MYLLVYKFGGSSVADAAGLRCAAGQLAEAAAAGFHIIAVVSAQGKTTDRLLQSTAELTAHPACREADQLLATGEQASAALMAMTLQERGLSAVSLTGWQAGFLTDSSHTRARIRRINKERLENELKMVSYHLTKGEQLESVLQQTFKEIEDIADVHQMTNAQLKRIIQKIEVDKDGNVDIYLRLFGDLGLDETVLIRNDET